MGNGLVNDIKIFDNGIDTRVGPSFRFSILSEHEFSTEINNTYLVPLPIDNKISIYIISTIISYLNHNPKKVHDKIYY